MSYYSPEQIFRRKGGRRMTSNIAPALAGPGNPIIYSPAPVYREAPALNPKAKPIKTKAKTKVKTKVKAKPKPKPKAKPKALRNQRSLFGGDVKNLFPSQRRDLSRRRSARKQAEKTKKTLGK